MNEAFIQMIFLMVWSGSLLGQPLFPELVARAYGSDQELINGIQFSNQYGGIVGHPYLLDGKFRAGSVCIDDRWIDGVLLRYNLYTQNVEIAYRTTEGNRNQIISVPGLMPAFSMGNFKFQRMDFPEDPPAYYQVVGSGNQICYVGWTREVEPTDNSSSKPYQFSSTERKYWLWVDTEMKSFHNRKSFIGIFPRHQQRLVSKWVKQQNVSFQQSSPEEVEAQIQNIFRLYDHPKLP